MNKKKIHVLLTRMPDKGSKILGIWTRSYYTHASIGLGEDIDTYYSFGYKGFRIESIQYYNHHDKGHFPCALYEIPVPEEIYLRVKKALDSFKQRKESLRYTKLGLTLALFKIPHKFKDQYICSQFVSEVLQDCQVFPKKKHPSLFMPGDFSKLRELKLIFQGTFENMPGVVC